MFAIVTITNNKDFELRRYLTKKPDVLTQEGMLAADFDTMQDLQAAFEAVVDNHATDEKDWLAIGQVTFSFEVVLGGIPKNIR